MNNGDGASTYSRGSAFEALSAGEFGADSLKCTVLDSDDATATATISIIGAYESLML